MPEKLIWQGKTSQLVNLPLFIACALMSGFIITAAMIAWSYLQDYSIDGLYVIGVTILALIPIFIAIWRALKIRFRFYQISTERLRVTQGVLNRRVDELELFRVNDNVLEQPFWLRIFGLANIVLFTSDLTDNRHMIIGIKDASKLTNLIRTYVEKMRLEKSITELDIKQHSAVK